MRRAQGGHTRARLEPEPQQRRRQSAGPSAEYAVGAAVQAPIGFAADDLAVRAELLSATQDRGDVQ
jgi:hypothetical protein